MLIARSSAMQPVHVDIELAARSDAKVLITGEPGADDYLWAKLHRCYTPATTT